MEVIWRRSAAFWSIVEDRPAGTQISHELGKGIDVFTDGLAAMVQMGDSKVRGENRHGIAEDQVVTTVEDSFLAFGKMIPAKKTWPLVSITSVYDGRTALQPSGVVLEADGKPAAA
jgi:hypothetical protein